ncbi:MAG: hypothetical protein KBE65_20685 [Phycisphaerae bacterium]|nr:hypothetical protein [Phycisphaerae bacterium]
MDDPPEEFLKRYDYLKDDFLAAIRRAAACERRLAEAAPGAGPIEVVFSLAGELLYRADGLIASLLGGDDYAFATVRSAQFRGARTVAREGPGGPLSHISKNVGDYAVEVATYRQQGGIEMEVEVLRQADKVPVRPFTFERLDTGGRSIVRATDIGPLDLVRFPVLAAGVYVFKVSWQDGSTEIRVEVK